jgi:hypothetical protein
VLSRDTYEAVQNGFSLIYLVLLFYPLSRFLTFGSGRSRGVSQAISAGQKFVWLSYCLLLSGIVFAAGLSARLTELARPQGYGLVRALAIGAAVGFLLSFWFRLEIFLTPNTLPLSATKRFEEEIVALRLLDAFCDEFWRAVCLLGLVKSGHNVYQAVLLTTIAFALGRLSLRNSVVTNAGAIVGGAVLGGAMGSLLLTTGSLLAALTARTVSLLSPRLFYERRSRSTASFMCPHCGTQIIRQSLSLVHSFECAECHASLRISRVYSIAARILAGAVALAACALWHATDSNFSNLMLTFALVFLVTYMPISFIIAKLFPPHVEEEVSQDLHLPR